MTIKRLAPAKINLYLDVLNKRKDGYHEIESIMQSISLCDKLTLKISDIQGENVIKIDTDSAKIPNDNSNLVYKATAKFIDYACKLYGIKISGKCFEFYIEKSIPVCAGMAGGSTDCACALLMLNQAFDYPFKDNELLTLGASLGADVGFCLIGGTAVCRGIGDEITPISKLSDAYIVCAIDDSSVSTPVAFKMIDDKYGTSPIPYGGLENMIISIKNGDISNTSSLLYNKFEAVIAESNKNINVIKNTLLENGAMGALMSGSGPSVFGIFSNENDSINAFKALESQKIRAFLCKTL
jgi:4-diphosphocytidyl-2-C-methyl-D-erythritol kinase